MLARCLRTSSVLYKLTYKLVQVWTCRVYIEARTYRTTRPKKIFTEPYKPTTERTILLYEFMRLWSGACQTAACFEAPELCPVRHQQISFSECKEGDGISVLSSDVSSGKKHFQSFRDAVKGYLTTRSQIVTQNLARREATTSQ